MCADPTGGPSAWKFTSVPNNATQTIDYVPSGALCVTLGDRFVNSDIQVMTSENPTASSEIPLSEDDERGSTRFFSLSPVTTIIHGAPEIGVHCPPPGNTRRSRLARGVSPQCAEALAPYPSRRAKPLPSPLRESGASRSHQPRFASSLVYRRYLDFRDLRRPWSLMVTGVV